VSSGQQYLSGCPAPFPAGSCWELCHDLHGGQGNH
jgi:hypothetical protein